MFVIYKYIYIYITERIRTFSKNVWARSTFGIGGRGGSPFKCWNSRSSFFLNSTCSNSCFCSSSKKTQKYIIWWAWNWVLRKCQNMHHPNVECDEIACPFLSFFFFKLFEWFTTFMEIHNLPWLQIADHSGSTKMNFFLSVSFLPQSLENIWVNGLINKIKVVQNMIN